MQGSLPGGTDAVDKIPVAALLKHWKTLVAHINITVWTTFPGYSFYLVGGWCQLYSSSDTNRLIRAWQKPELVVISESSGRLRRNTRISFCLRPPLLA